MSGAMNRHCIPGLTMSTAPMGTSLRECPGIIKTMHTGFSAYDVLHYANVSGAGHLKKTGRYDLAWKDLCKNLNAQ